ncbi:filamentous hemagglutinin N-terminal domain-containing protein [Morganella morganii subsp. sibonii]
MKITRLTAAILTLTPVVAFAAPVTEFEYKKKGFKITVDERSEGVNIRIPKDTKKPTLSITAPDANGISHNYFTEFNVGRRGLNIDNKNAAQTIINEVTGPDITRLRGNINVLANKATLIIANPNGINCNQCDVTNVEHFVKAAGKIIYENDKMAGYSNITGDIAYFNTTVENRALVMNDFAKNIKIKNSKLAPDALVLMSGFTGYKYTHKPVALIQDDSYRIGHNYAVVLSYYVGGQNEKDPTGMTKKWQQWDPEGTITIDENSVLSPISLIISAENSGIYNHGAIDTKKTYINLLHSYFSADSFEPFKTSTLNLRMRNSIFSNSGDLSGGRIDADLYGSNEIWNSESMKTSLFNITVHKQQKNRYFKDDEGVLTIDTVGDNNYFKNNGGFYVRNFEVQAPNSRFTFKNSGLYAIFNTKNANIYAKSLTFENTGKMNVTEKLAMTGENSLFASSKTSKFQPSSKYQFKVNREGVSPEIKQ